MSPAQSRPKTHARLEFPQLAPFAAVIQRAAHEIQVGIDPDNALVFRGSGFGELMGLLNGSRPTSAIQHAGRAGGLTIEQITGALDALAAAGLLTERAVVPYTGSLGSSNVRLIGAGAVGHQLARLLAASGLGTLYVYDDEPPHHAVYPAAGVLASRAEALRSALADTGTTISTLSHWSKPETDRLDLTILACDRPEPNRAITDHLIHTDQPHLLLRCWGNGVSVGPLVIPGQTSCVRCSDLARSDADPAWPAVLGQLSRTQIDAPPTLLGWVASVAAAQALAFLHGELPESAGSTLELGWPDFVTRLRRWPCHPRCGCDWSSHTEWGP
ncbi:MAG: ThiF family adenylyltransferase [Propionibacteriaceae bacterium]